MVSTWEMRVSSVLWPAPDERARVDLRLARDPRGGRLHAREGEVEVRPSAPPPSPPPARPPPPAAPGPPSRSPGARSRSWPPGARSAPRPAGPRELRLRLGLDALGLGHARLERTRIDRVEELALPDEAALLVVHGVQEALDAGAHLDLRRAPGLADDLDVDGHVALDDRGHLDLGRGRGRGFLLAARAATGTPQRARRSSSASRAFLLHPPGPQAATHHLRLHSRAATARLTSPRPRARRLAARSRPRDGEAARARLRPATMERLARGLAEEPAVVLGEPAEVQEAPVEGDVGHPRRWPRPRRRS